jgi:mono/diheme cytochrome c family protein
VIIESSSRRLWFSAAAAGALVYLVLGIGRYATQAQAGSQPGAQTPAPQTTPATPPPAQRPGILVAPGGAGGRGVYEAPAADDPANANADLSPKPPVLPLPPAEQARRFWLPPGYRLTPVLADPDIEEPGQIAFDGNGRMFVVELRGYDQTRDGIDLTPPIGRISVHEDRDNDGVYEHHSAFVDKLVFPRFVTPFGANSILTMETNTDEVWKYTDTNNDGVADKKELFTTNFGRAGNLEHQQAGLFWAMDNWLYSTVNAFRIRWTPNGVLREPTGPNGAQWGATQDNFGKVWFQGGASGMPGYFQFPVHYGNLAVQGQTEPNLNVIWGAPILIGDIQAGMPGTRQPDGSLILATASGGNDIYRGDRLPADLVGDLLYGELVGRSVRRLKAVKTEGLTQLRNAYPLSEFIRSLDPLFRPTDVVTAPDGTVYISDMYRGIIEGAPWAKEGTYLRKKIDQYQLHKILGKGRIWRLTYDGMERDRTQPRMLNETPAQLVTHLSHPNGWWRDTAQQLLVLEQDKSVVPALQQLVRTPAAGGAADARLFGRFHALWTLEGLGALDAALVREQLKDANPAMRIQAIRASETLYKAGDRSLAADYKAAARDADTDVVIQAMLTLNLFKVPDLAGVVQAAQAANKSRGVQEVGQRILQPAPSLMFGGRAGGRGGGALTPELTTTLQRGATVYNEVCAACHAPDGLGTVIEGRAGATMAPPLVSSTRVHGHRDYTIKTILHGMTGPIDGKNYGVMVPMGTNTDEWIASVASYVRSGSGGSGWLVTPADVARVRAATAGRKTPWTLEELEASLPRALVADATWKITASHNAADAAQGVNFLGWNTRAPQQAGMWFQVELPAPVMLTEIQFNSPPQGGGRGNPPAVATFPRGYDVQVSADGKTWSAPVAQGQGSGATTVIAFAPVRARFVRLTQTATVADAPSWAVQGLRLFEQEIKR